MEVADPQSSNIRKYRMLVVVHQPILKKHVCQNGNHLPQVVVKIKTCCQKHHADTVDRRNAAAVDICILFHLSP